MYCLLYMLSASATILLFNMQQIYKYFTHCRIFITNLTFRYKNKKKPQQNAEALIFIKRY